MWKSTHKKKEDIKIAIISIIVIPILFYICINYILPYIIFIFDLIEKKFDGSPLIIIYGILFFLFSTCFSIFFLFGLYYWVLCIHEILSFLWNRTFVNINNILKRMWRNSPKRLSKDFDKSMYELSKIFGTQYTPGSVSFANIDKIEWCLTCKYFRRINNYEDKLWLLSTVLPDDYIPCKIINQTKDIWQKQYSTQFKHRTLYPKNCPKWTRKNWYQFLR